MHGQARIRNGADSLHSVGSSHSGLNVRESMHGTQNAEVARDRLRVAVLEIFEAVSYGLQDQCDSARKCMQRANAILRIDPWFAEMIEAFDLPIRRRSKSAPGGLAPCQIRRITRHIERNLTATMRNKELAAIVRVSSSHFSRAFKVSFADTPHRYIVRRRMERAKALMLTTDASLGRIAAECGFSDQPHFNRLFRRLIGDSPRAWRRERECDCQDRDAGALESRSFKRLKSLDDTEADGEGPRRRHCLDEIGVLRLNG